jgi:hypothetical protein
MSLVRLSVSNFRPKAYKASQSQVEDKVCSNSGRTTRYISLKLVE